MSKNEAILLIRRYIFLQDTISKRQLMLYNEVINLIYINSKVIKI